MTLILGLVFSHGFVEYAILSVLMYFIIETEDNLLKAAAIVNGQESLSLFIVLIVAYFADGLAASTWLLAPIQLC
ncbi:hypothetical protein CCACVL1_12446 [Corchorus capsularis]|uniref:Uncharacterized protein n=1 Tax=Corchorus capsularis TaxID=210143 RepID=A0A1R3IFT9_COCAP|nr:hypothetical protein CCACVL1_12446 [Corchorus capsularis]